MPKLFDNVGLYIVSIVQCTYIHFQYKSILKAFDHVLHVGNTRLMFIFAGIKIKTGFPKIFLFSELLMCIKGTYNL